MRRFEFAVDRAHAHAVNETMADIRRRRWYAAAAAVLLGLGAGLFVVLDDAWAYIVAVVFVLGAVTALFVALRPSRRSRDIERLYTEGELVPTVVSGNGSTGTTLLALVDFAKPGTSTAEYALVTREVHSLPGHRRVPGERVPAVAVPVDRDGDMWQSVGVMPIAWATRDATVIERARAVISEVEWALLTDNLGLAAKVDASGSRRLLLDPHELPKELRR